MDILFQQIANGLVVGSSYVLVALGLTLIFGVLIIPNLAHGETYMVGAFTTYTLVSALGWNFWLSIAVGLLAGAAVGIGVYELAFRPLERAPLLTHFISALAIATILSQLAVLVWGNQTQVTGAPIRGTTQLGPVVVTRYSVIIVAVALVSAALLKTLLARTWFGRAMRAVAQNRPAAELMGISIRGVSYATFAIGSALAALAGGMLGGIFPIHPTMGLVPVLKAFVVITLGGVGSIGGAVAGGLFLGVMESLGTGYLSSDYRNVIAFGVLVLVLVVRPTGIAGREIPE